MRYFLDTEFNTVPFDGFNSLISIAIVAEDGREFYAVNRDMDMRTIRHNKWLMDNVVDKLEGPADPVWMHRNQIIDGIEKLIGDDTSPQIWAYYGAYDWVLLCELFGGMLTLSGRNPEWPMYVRDLKMLVDLLDFPKSLRPDDPENEHHALADARWNLLLFKSMEEGARRLGCAV